jgi:hypothetical protein
MDESNRLPTDTGLDVIEISECKEFWERELRLREFTAETQAVLRLCETFLENPDGVLQELVKIALELCGADSAGVSLAQPGHADETYWLWVAVAGEYGHFQGTTLPRFPSACGLCLERGGPQHVRVRSRFFDLLKVDAKPVTDGILLPWTAGDRQGTFWVLAHGRTEAFDPGDLTLLKTLTDFAALCWRKSEREDDVLGVAVGGDELAISKKLGELVMMQRRQIADLLQSSAANRAAAERQCFEEEQTHLAEMGRRLQEWVGDGNVQ